VLTPIRNTQNGTYTLRLELKPPELGRVEMRVEMRDGVLHASINAEHPRTAELVRNALDDLRAQLDADGVRSGSLTVGGGSTGAPDQDPDAQPNSPDTSTPVAPVADHPITPGSTTTSDSLLDVRI
jgi:flagellar hook-length control protein FliK